MTAYYNENDPKAAAWLRELIKAGAIAPGEVDERSIEDVTPRDLEGFAQCHFFAGIGGWSRALRLAHVPDTYPLWTGSCPCQPFSTAGKRGGFDDKRHLWPAWHWLIQQRRPGVVFGEQVANSGPWFDLVSTDLEAEGYTIGSAVLGAHSAGAPHIRQRRYFVAHTGHQSWGLRIQPRGPRFDHAEAGGSGEAGGMAVTDDAERRSALAGRNERDGDASRWNESNGEPGEHREAGELGDASSAGSGRNAGTIPGAESRVEWGLRCLIDVVESASAAGRMADRGGEGLEEFSEQSARDQRATAERGGEAGGLADSSGERHDGRRSVQADADATTEPEGPRTTGFWSGCLWIPCRDGKARPIEPGTFPLAYGVPARVGRLRGYGNAIVPQTAAIFIEAAIEAMKERELDAPEALLT